MKTKYTKAYILSNRGCHSRDIILGMDFIIAKNYTYKGIISSNDLSLADKFWWLIKKTNLTKDQKLEISIRCAEIVLPIFEDKYQNDDRPRKAIKAAKNKNADADAAAAYAAAAADADDAAAAAAYAAAYAADAYAAYDADAAAAAAATAADAADAADAKYKTKLLKILKEAGVLTTKTIKI